MSTEFRDALQHAGVHNTYSMTGTGHCFASGRLSYVLGLHGACEAIDTACSASLVACHHACRAILAQDCETALLAGVNMMLLPSTTQGYAAAGITSAIGKAFVFDARADGFVRGEACSTGIFTSGDGGKAVLTGSAVRQDGRSASLTAPNGRAQQLLLEVMLGEAALAQLQLV